MIYDEPRIYSLSDTSVAVEFGDEASPALNVRTLRFCQQFRDLGMDGVIEVCPAMGQVAVVLDRERTTHAWIISAIGDLLGQLAPDEGLLRSRLFHIPVWYDDPWSFEAARASGVGNNCELVAGANGLTVDEMIDQHQSTDYWLGLVGFTPGAAQGLAVDPSKVLTAPKYLTPRTYTPARCVACAGTGTTIYPVRSPGGFQMIGRAAVEVYTTEPWSPAFGEDGVLLSAGDRLRFSAVDAILYDDIREAIARRTYEYLYEDEEIDLSPMVAAYIEAGSRSEQVS